MASWKIWFSPMKSRLAMLDWPCNRVPHSQEVGKGPNCSPDCWLLKLPEDSCLRGRKDLNPTALTAENGSWPWFTKASTNIPLQKPIWPSWFVTEKPTSIICGIFLQIEVLVQLQCRFFLYKKCLYVASTLCYPSRCVRQWHSHHVA